MKKQTLSGSLSSAAHLFRGKYQEQAFKLSEYQEKLFRVATKGYEAFTPQERAKLTYNDRKMVEKAYGVTRRVLNELKQTYTTNTITHLFGKLFPDARGNALPFLMMKQVDRTYTCHVPLRVPKKVLIKKLVEEGVLPKETFQNIAA